MRIFFDNVNFGSHSGPNSFGVKLAHQLEKEGNQTNLTFYESKEAWDAQLTFIQTHNFSHKRIFQRLDGIYFNTDQDFKSLNSQIVKTYKNSTGVIFQSEFNKILSEKWFGKHDNSAVIRNGTLTDTISAIPKFDLSTNPNTGSYKKAWMCASSWRPHKRLKENIDYFLETADDETCMLVAGNVDRQMLAEIPEVVSNPRIIFCGNITNWNFLISLYKASERFVHLSFLDHCPNVVVDARSAGCQIVCASSGGTKEIAGKDAIIVDDLDWDFSPIKLYSPPKLDFSKTSKNKFDVDLRIERASKEYIEFLGT